MGCSCKLTERLRLTPQPSQSQNRQSPRKTQAHQGSDFQNKTKNNNRTKRNCNSTRRRDESKWQTGGVWRDDVVVGSCDGRGQARPDKGDGQVRRAEVRGKNMCATKVHGMSCTSCAQVFVHHSTTGPRDEADTSRDSCLEQCSFFTAWGCHCLS